METVLLEKVRPGIALVTLNRPEKLNALSLGTLDDLAGALDEVSRDRDCRVAVLTGAGRGFSAGLDLSDSGAGGDDGTAVFGDPRAAMVLQQRFAALVPALRAVPKPVVAAVNGAASGGGFALALASDVRVAAESARFNVAPVRLGLSGCDVGISYLLPRLVGASRAFELMLTGRFVDAAEADRIGLVSRVVPDGQVVETAMETAELIAANSPFGVWMTKEVMWSSLEVGSLQAGLDLENRTQVLAIMTGDFEEAIRAFQEKRPPRFSA